MTEHHDEAELPTPHIVTRGPAVEFSVITGPYQFERVQKWLPMNPAPGHVRIKVHTICICGSDEDLFKSGNQFTGYSGPMTPLPTTFGHEFDGTVVEIGQGVERLQHGNHVVVEPYLPCRRDDCPACSLGRFNACREAKCLGFPPEDGAMMGLIDVPARNCYLVPFNLDGQVAALTELLAIMHHGNNITLCAKGGYYELIPKQWIAIVGFGKIGAADLLYLKRHTIHRILVIARSQEQQELALSLGADAVCEFSLAKAAKITDEMIGQVDETTGNLGCLEWATRLAATSPGGGATMAFGCYNTDLKIRDRWVQKDRRNEGGLRYVRRSNGEALIALHDLAAAPEYYRQLLGRRLDHNALHLIRDPEQGDRIGNGNKHFFQLSEREK